MGRREIDMDATYRTREGAGLRTALLTIAICSLSIGGLAIAQTTIVPNGAAAVTTPYPGNIGTAAGQPASAAALPSTLPQAPVTSAVAEPAQPQAQAQPQIPAQAAVPAPHAASTVAANQPGYVPAPVPQIPGATAQASQAATTPATGGAPGPAITGAAPQAGAAPNEANPFSNVRESTDSAALKAQLPTIEQRLRQVESRVSAIQQVQVALPPEALNQGGGGRIAGSGAAPMDDESVEMQTATFIACVNGRAMFRDSDQKPFFVDAKEAAQNDTVRRIGGCKH